MNKYIQAVTTTASREESEAIARTVVEERLAACVQVDGPITSVYRWEGRIETAAEWRCVMKTRVALWPALAARVRQLHSYQTPEIVALPIESGDAAYLAWLVEETTPPSPL